MAAVTAAVATTVAAGASMYNSYQQWDAAQDAKDDAKDMQNARNDQAADILDQIESEDLIYEDDLDMIRKQTALAEEKLDLQVSTAFDQTGDKLSDVVASTYGGKFEGGASKRSARKARQQMEESSADILKTFEMGQQEIALQNEESERAAEQRKDDIIGSLEATYMELTGEDMPSNESPETTTPSHLDGMTEEEIEDLYDEQTGGD